MATIFGDDLIHWPAYFILHTTTTCHYIAGLMFHIKNISDLMIISSWLIHIAAGAFVGVALALIFKHFGENSAYIKGLGVGLTMWVIHVVVIPNLIASVQPYTLRTPTEVMVDLLHI